MLKIFLSSTFRDLKDPRLEILKKLNSVFDGVGMEEFIPDGSYSQEVCIGNLKKMKEDGIVIFLISPYYGSLMESCSLKDACKAECPMKIGKGRVSYTHCEYKTTIAEGILHQTYLTESNWDDPKIKEEARDFKKEIENTEFRFGISDFRDPAVVQRICNNLVEKVLQWHTQKKLTFTNFCDRTEELNRIMENVDDKIEIYGVGGIGKTALIQIVLLLQKLKGKQIIAIGSNQSYASGSGYEFFRKKCKDSQYKVSRKRITIYDIIDALSKFLPNAEETKKKQKHQMIEIISDFLRKKEDILIFIDDFHLVDEDVRNLVKSINCIILSSRKNTRLATKAIGILGIGESEREDFVDLICKLSDQTLSIKAKEKIIEIAEGHPVTTKLLVQNSQDINFKKLEQINFDKLDSYQVEEFYKRVIKDILSDQGYQLLKNLSVLNTGLDSNINREVANESYGFTNIEQIFRELVFTRMLKKKLGEDVVYEFVFKHIKDVLEEQSDKEDHINAIRYYEKKKEISNNKSNLFDDIEVINHDLKLKLQELDNKFQEDLAVRSHFIQRFVGLISAYNKLIPQDRGYGYKRLIEIGEELNKAVEFKDLNETKHITAFWVSVIQRNEDKALICNNLGSLYQAMNMYDEAIEMYSQTNEIYRSLSQSHPITRRRPSYMGESNEYWNYYQEFKEKIDKSTEKIAYSQYMLGKLLVESERMDEGEKAFLQGTELFLKLIPKILSGKQTGTNISQEYTGEDLAPRIVSEIEKIEFYLETILEVFPNNCDALYYKARIESLKNNKTDSIKYLEKTVELDKTYIERARGEINFFNIRKLKKFEALIGEISHYFFDSIEYIHKFAELEEGLEKFESELAKLEHKPNKIDKKTSIIREKGLFLNEKGKHKKALECFDELLEIDPENELAWNYKGITLQELNRYDEAIKCYDKSIEIAQSKFLTETEKRKNSYQKFIPVRENKSGDSWYNKARIESLRKNEEKSIEFLKKAIEASFFYERYARNEKDFDNIKDSKIFKELIGNDN